jgi:hypothetical protein
MGSQMDTTNDYWKFVGRLSIHQFPRKRRMNREKIGVRNRGGVIVKNVKVI